MNQAESSAATLNRPPSHASTGNDGEAKTALTVLVTGASGYLGRSLCAVLSERFEVLRMDTADGSGSGEFLRGSITDRGVLEPACERADVLVLAHMASTRSEAYDWPDVCMDVNVKGVALALEAAARHKIRRVILISSVSVVWGHVLAKTYLTASLPPFPTEMYGMTKTLQEQLAGYYHRVRGLEIAVLRPAYILDEDSLVNKYGANLTTVTWQCIDPRDIGRAATAAIDVPDLDCETFYLMAGPGVEKFADIDSTRKRLGWEPVHRFAGIAIEEI